MTLKYLVRDTDRHGKGRIYFRYRGHAKILLEAPEGSPEFMAEYEAAKAARLRPAPQKPAPDVIVRGSLRWLCVEFMTHCAGYLTCKAITRRIQKGQLDNLCLLVLEGSTTPCGSIMIRDIRAKHIQKIIDSKSAVPFAANNLLKVLKKVFHWAFKQEYVAANPVIGVDRLKTRKGGHAPWGAPEIAAYLDQHPLDTQAGLALAIFFFTGARKSDAVKLGRQNETEGGTALRWRETKGGEIKITEVPIYPEFRRVLDMHGAGDRMLYLQTKFGKAFTANGFGNKVRRWCDAAGLPDFSAHGIRKGSATAAANLGATGHDLKGMFGWSNLKDTQIYTEGADRKEGAKRAASKLSLENITGSKVSNRAK